MSGAKTRLAAGQILMAVIENRQKLDTALAMTTSFQRLSACDRRFARAMVSAALRMLGRIDIGLEPLLDRPLNKTSPFVRALLRIGAAQAWVLATPAHAVVDATVAAARLWSRNHARAKVMAGFLNAVLRRVATERAAFDSAPVEACWPEWTQKVMCEQIGPAACSALAQAQTRQPDLYFTPKDGDGNRLASRLDGTVIASHSVCAQTQAVTSLPGFADGDWWVQDVAATLAARLLEAQAGETVFDICAAPGGKTMQLAAMGAHVTAVDRSPSRLRQLEQNLVRTGLQNRVEIVQADATMWKPGRLADKILVDAPCSAFGTLQRHPEGAWIKSQADMARLPDIQESLLRAALRMLKPGGTVVYCVCSPLPNEGAAIVRRVLAQGGVYRIPVTAGEIPGFETCLQETGDILTLPGNTFAHDTFYISRLALS